MVGLRKRVQFFLGTARDKGHVHIRSPAMSKCDCTEWIELLIQSHTVWSRGRRGGGEVIMVGATRKGSTGKEKLKV